MMSNPILKNYKSRIVYIALWTAFSGVQIGVLSHIVILRGCLPYLAADVIWFNAPMALLLLYVWIPVNVIRWSSDKWLHYVSAHLMMAIIITGASFCLNRIVMLIVTGGDDYNPYPAPFGPRFLIGVTAYAFTVMIYYLYIFVKRLREKQINEIRLTQTIKTAELNLLKSQLNPHFLFNSLNSLNSLIMYNPQQAQDMLLALSDYLRYTVLSNKNPFSSLQQEISNIEKYLSIEKVRFGSRLVYEFRIPDPCMQAQIPSMLLQPLIENAMKHSVYESLQEVLISVEAGRAGEYLTISIANTCDQQPAPARSKGTGTGLGNIRERLWILYEHRAGLQTAIEAGRFVAILHLPFFTQVKPNK